MPCESGMGFPIIYQTFSFYQGITKNLECLSTKAKIRNNNPTMMLGFIKSNENMIKDFSKK